MTRTPRPHQTKAIADIRAAYNAGYERILYQLPTGGGKTDIMAMMCEVAMKTQDQVVRIDVHRDTLIEQFKERLELFGLDFGVVAGGHPEQPEKRIQLASVYSMAKRLDRYPKPDIVLNDEAHHVPATQWRKCAVPDAVTIGFTATPWRLDGKGLRDYFDVLICGPQPKELIRDGYLVTPWVFVPTRVDASGARTTKQGDWNTSDLDDIIDASGIVGSAIESYKEHCFGLPAVAFCASVKSAQKTADAFNAAGIPAASIDGKMSKWEIRQILHALKVGVLKVVTSCELIAEGFDLPAVTVCIMLRPTKSLTLYLQAIGRVLRAAEGKTHAYLLDHVGNMFNEGFGMPHANRDWTLDGRPKVERSERDAIPKVVQCKECYSWFEPEPVCPVCGADMGHKMREIREIEGKLTRLEEERAAELFKKTERQSAQKEIQHHAYKAKSRQELILFAMERGFDKNYAMVAWMIAQKKKGGKPSAGRRSA